MIEASDEVKQFAQGLNEIGVEIARLHAERLAEEPQPALVGAWLEGVLTGIMLERHFSPTAAEFIKRVPSMLQVGGYGPADAHEIHCVDAARTVHNHLRGSLTRDADPRN